MINHSKPYYDEDDIQSVLSTIQRSYTASMGPKTQELQNKLKDYYGAQKVVLTNTASMALVLALLINGIKDKDKVLIPTYICSEVRDAILMTGATPILCDINDNDYSIDESILKKIYKDSIKTVIVPHMFGIPANLEPLLKYNTPIIEDLAQGIGAKYNNKPVGCIGNIAVVSFKSIKMLGAGEGGALIINNKALADSFDTVIENHYIASLYHMSDLTAALALSQFNKLDYFLNKRLEIAKMYLNHLNQLSVDIPQQTEGYSWYRFLIKHNKEFDYLELKDKFEKKGVQIRKPVDTLLHQKYSDHIKDSSFAVAEKVFNSIISIPIYPALSEDEANKVCEACISLL